MMGQITPIPCEHCGHAATYRTREQLQQPYRGAWQALVAWANEMSPDMAFYRSTLGAKLAEIVDRQPHGRDAFALNTTRYGREVGE